MAIKKNKINDYFKRKKEIVEKNRIDDHSERESEIESANNHLLDVIFSFKEY